MTTESSTTKDTQHISFEELLKDNDAYTTVPHVGKLIKGTILSITKKEIHIDVGGLTTGIVRGRELFEDFQEYQNLQVGNEVEATVLDLENENGEMELSFRSAGQQKIWDRLLDLQQKKTVIPVKIIEANKGGLLVQLEQMRGFLPVSQLTPEHYPRVSGGDKHKILERLRSYVDQEFMVKVIDIDQDEEKLIVSEKAAWEEQQKEVLSKFTSNEIVEGTISALTDFGAFLAFGDGVEGLIHISEIAWQRIDHPKDVLTVGDKVKAQILKVDGAKIFLSLKRLAENPWDTVREKYAVGQEVRGKIIKVNPFGFFVEIEPQIHGLAHISELGKRGIVPEDIAQVDEEHTFKIISLDAQAHRMGLSLSVDGKGKKVKKDKKVQAEKEEEIKDASANEKTSEHTQEKESVLAKKAEQKDSAPEDKK